MPARTYDIEVAGELGQRYAAALKPMKLQVGDGTTTIVADIADQAQLLGLIDHIAALGLDLISINPVAGAGQPQPQAG